MAAVSDGAPDRRCRILIAEDNPEQLGLLKIMLEPLPVDVQYANTGELALAMWHAAKKEGTPYDLIVTDDAMPMKTGMTVLAEIRNEGDDVPVIMVTALQPYEVEQDARKHAAFCVLFKPEGYVYLVEHMTAALRSRGCKTEWVDDDTGEIKMERAMDEKSARRAFTSTSAG
jgi:CheY-like chemotaxis protein